MQHIQEHKEGNNQFTLSGQVSRRKWTLKEKGHFPGEKRQERKAFSLEKHHAGKFRGEFVLLFVKSTYIY